MQDDEKERSGSFPSWSIKRCMAVTPASLQHRSHQHAAAEMEVQGGARVWACRDPSDTWVQEDSTFWLQPKANLTWFVLMSCWAWEDSSSPCWLLLFFFFWFIVWYTSDIFNSAKEKKSSEWVSASKDSFYFPSIFPYFLMDLIKKEMY